MTAVLPAEYGIDPPGLGGRLGLLALANTAQAAPASEPAPAYVLPPAAPADTDTAALSAQAAAVFGKQPGQSFDARAVTHASAAPRTDTMSVTLAPGGSGRFVQGFTSTRRAQLENYWMADHAHSPASTKPVLVMDMYEHSYQMDYGAASAKYIDAFFQNIQWDVVASWLAGLPKA